MASPPRFYPPLRLLLGGLDPLIVRAVFHLHVDNPLQDLADEADKVGPPQRVLPRPGAPLALLALQQLRVARLARADLQVAHHRHQVEPDLALRVPLDPALDHLDDLLGETVHVARPVANGERLQAVQLVEHAVDGRVGDEVIHIRVLVGGRALCLVDEGRRPGERVVRGADDLRVGQRLAAEVGGEARGEFLERGQLGSDVDGHGRRRGGVLVEDHGEDGLRAAGVLDRLPGEEDAVVGRVLVIGAVRRGGRVARLASNPLEEEDDAVDGAVAMSLSIVLPADAVKPTLANVSYRHRATPALQTARL